MIREYTLLNNETISVIKKTDKEKIEDETDIAILEKAIENSIGKTYTAEEVGKELDFL